MTGTVKERPPVILWFRRDLRLSDNAALRAACDTGSPVICVFIRSKNDPYAGANGAAQAWWLHHSLHALNAALQAKGNRLLLLTGDAGHILEWLVAETGANTVVWNRRYDPEGIRTDSELKSRLRGQGINADSYHGFLMHEPSRLLTKDGRKYQVYTPFWRNFEASFQSWAPIPAPDDIASGALALASENLEDWHLLPQEPDWATTIAAEWTPGETAAQAQLSKFVTAGLDDYKAARDQPAMDNTSRLSPSLAFGEISPNQIWHSTLSLADTMPVENVVHFRKEVVWREFSWHLLFHNPDLATVNLNRKFDAFPWVNDEDNLSAWQIGLTGYPIVDAGMRQLWQTGWMHNRVRMITASFLIKDLLIDWRTGERWFRDTLVDADLASNAASWQWVAGCGADAAPYFRIFNPVTQGEKFDAEGAYIRKYCPELARLPKAFIHRPWEAPPLVLKAAGITLGRDYPAPVVAHDVARKKALEAYSAMRASVQD